MRKILFYIICSIIFFFSFISLKVNALSNINLSDGTLNPSFDRNIYKYNIYIDNPKEIAVVPSLDEGEIYEKEGLINLIEGENLVELKILKDNKTYVYALKFFVGNIVEEKEALLKELKIKNYDIDFDKRKFEYNITIFDEEELIIEYIPENEGASVILKGNSNLKTGSNKITIEVKFENSKNIYTLNINKTKEVFKEETKKKNSIFSKVILNNQDKLAIKIIIILAIMGIILALFYLLFLKNNKKKYKYHSRK